MKHHHLTLWIKIKIDLDPVYTDNHRWIKHFNIKGKLLCSFLSQGSEGLIN